MRAPAFGSDGHVESVRAADPLRADDVCRRLPAMNERSDVAGMVTTLRELLPPRQLAGFTAPDCVAALRDLGMFLGSIKRHGTEPAGAVPEILPVLAELGRRTDMVSRDTVHHYTAWNPRGPRQRMYTGDEQEAILQEAVRHVFGPLRDGLELCERLGDLHPAQAGFADLVDEIDDRVTSMVESITRVTAGVDPVFFARTLRPYFEEITLDGELHLGPAAAQVPLWLIDEAIWLSDRGILAYEEFLLHSVPYALPRWRALHLRWRTSPSTVTRLVDAFTEATGPDGDTGRAPPELHASAAALARLLRTSLVFRGRHLKIARQAYREELRLYQLGSGGGTVDLLRQVLDLTRDNERIARQHTERDRSADEGASA